MDFRRGYSQSRGNASGGDSICIPFLIPGAQDLATFGAHATSEPGYENFDNTLIFQNAVLAAKHITITQPGTYLLSGSILLNDSQTIEGAAGVILKRSAVYSHIFTNRQGAGPTQNTNITIKNLTLDESGVGGYGGQISPTSKGVINMHFVNGLAIENITIINGSASLFGCHFQEVQNATITNYTYSGRCGIQMQGGCSNITIDGFDITSTDDAFAINVEDYPNNQYSARDAENIIIRNGTSRPIAGQVGYFLRFETGSWTDWAIGNAYEIGHICVNAGKLYKSQTAGPIVAANAPTHTDGDVTGADGIKWRKLYAPIVIYTSNVRDVTVHNVSLLCGRPIVRYMSSDIWDHSEYPGTENTSILDEFHTSLSSDDFVNGGGLLGNVYFDEVP